MSCSVIPDYALFFVPRSGSLFGIPLRQGHIPVGHLQVVGHEFTEVAPLLNTYLYRGDITGFTNTSAFAPQALGCSRRAKAVMLRNMGLILCSVVLS